MREEHSRERGRWPLDAISDSRKEERLKKRNKRLGAKGYQHEGGRSGLRG